ncbi:MAG: hypothetical protein EAZ14_11515, partial [Runella slithyformis]
MQETTEIFWLWQFLGRLHPLVVHFPVSLLCVALLLQVIDWRRKSAELKASITILVWVGAISSLVAVALGLLLSNIEEYNGDTVTIHQWSGIATMLLAGLTIFALKTQRELLYRSSLILSTIGVAVAGHFGAMLTHGDDYLTSVLPFNQIQQTEGTGDGTNFTLASVKGPLTEPQIQELNLEVRSIFAHNCYSCHGEGKTKGELRLDKKEFIFKGGKHGPVIEAGKPESSEIIRRITLPTGHKEAMPTKGKRLTEKEISILEYWIKQGAPWPSGTE